MFLSPLRPLNDKMILSKCSRRPLDSIISDKCTLFSPTIRHSTTATTNTETEPNNDNEENTTAEQKINEPYHLPYLSGWRNALTAAPYRNDINDNDDVNENKKKSHETFFLFKLWNVTTKSWQDYKETWGFFDKTNEEKTEKGTTLNDITMPSLDDIQERQKDVQQNFKKNIQTIQQDLQTAKQTYQNESEEIKEWVGQQIKFANQCVGEFMKGYRKGRDDEVEKMLHDYFQDFFDDSNKKKNENNPNKEANTASAITKTTTTISDGNRLNKESNNITSMVDSITHDDKNTTTQVIRGRRKKVRRRIHNRKR